MESVFEKRVRERIAGKVAEKFTAAGIGSVILAGGGLLKQFKDLDFYPTTEHRAQFDALVLSTPGITKNSATLFVDGVKVQLCRYYKPTVAELIASFDFTHCQIAAVIRFGDQLQVEVHKTAAFTVAMESEGTAFTGSEYPLASLARLFKVSKKRSMSRVSVAGNMIRILTAIVGRGFLDWDDFKDQLDAVDLRLGVKDIEGFEDDARRLFDLLQKGGK